ncbi:hypothetical protein C2E23DRAFT_452404 [Lenzites betulinus]|nr:hypothetical protein C2E23DRAFT_452404 [Lenzites betulinus]
MQDSDLLVTRHARLLFSSGIEEHGRLIISPERSKCRLIERLSPLHARKSQRGLPGKHEADLYYTNKLRPGPGRSQTRKLRRTPACHGRSGPRHELLCWKGLSRRQGASQSALPKVNFSVLDLALSKSGCDPSGLTTEAKMPKSDILPATHTHIASAMKRRWSTTRELNFASIPTWNEAHKLISIYCRADGKHSSWASLPILCSSLHCRTPLMALAVHAAMASVSRPQLTPLYPFLTGNRVGISSPIARGTLALRTPSGDRSGVASLSVIPLRFKLRRPLV